LFGFVNNRSKELREDSGWINSSTSFVDAGKSDSPMTKKVKPSGQKHLLQALERLHHKHGSCHEGEVATYIPELAKANPDHFGIAVVKLKESRIFGPGFQPLKFIPNRVNVSGRSKDSHRVIPHDPGFHRVISAFLQQHPAQLSPT
jgi:hypothetical protein